jgi:hypothetical protein
MVAFIILGTGVLLGGVTLWRAGLTRVRTVYRPDTWALPESLVSAAGVTVLGIFLIAHSQISQALVLTPELNNWPALPLWGLIAFTVACTPALSSPRPPDLNSDADAELKVEVRT